MLSDCLPVGNGSGSRRNYPRQDNPATLPARAPQLPNHAMSGSTEVTSKRPGGHGAEMTSAYDVPDDGNCRTASTFHDSLPRAVGRDVRGAWHPPAAVCGVHNALQGLTGEELEARCDALARTFLDQGVTFDVGGEERPFPLDIVPRVIAAGRVGRGRARRAAAGPGARGVPGRRLRRRARRSTTASSRARSDQLSSAHFHRAAAGIDPANGVRVHVSGIDLIRDERRRAAGCSRTTSASRPASAT